MSETSTIATLRGESKNPAAKTWALSATADFETMSVPETNRCKHQ
jgi:hypothetical protein